MSQIVHTEGKNKHISQSLSKVWFESSAQWARSHVPSGILMAGERKKHQFLPTLHPSIRGLHVCSLLASRYNCEMPKAGNKTSRWEPSEKKSCVCPGSDGNKERGPWLRGYCPCHSTNTEIYICSSTYSCHQPQQSIQSIRNYNCCCLSDRHQGKPFPWVMSSNPSNHSLK